MNRILDSKVIVITGGVGLIGKAFVSAVLEAGGTSIIADINEADGRDLEAKLSEKFGAARVCFCRLDITVPESVTELISKATGRYGRIDAWVNNAYPRNANYGRRFFDVEHLDFCENISMHLGGYFLCSQQIAACFLRQGGGTIINIASIYGVRAPRFDIYNETEMTTPVEYATAKSAIIHLTKYMAQYFKGRDIRVNSISPGGIYNAQPIAFVKRYKALCAGKGMLDTSDLIGTLIFLLSDSAAVINGQNIIVDDGFTL